MLYSSIRYIRATFIPVCFKSASRFFEPMASLQNEEPHLFPVENGANNNFFWGGNLISIFIAYSRSDW